MANILIAWELGEAFGHLARCLRLAIELRNRGHEVVLVLKDTRLPGQAVCAKDIVMLQAPHSSPRQPTDRRMPVNYADVLLRCGFDDVRELAGRLHAWQGTLGLVRPDVVVADHAPTALLAAHRAGVPHVAVGNGFVIPPLNSPWPTIRPWEEVPEQNLFIAEQLLDQVTDDAQMALGGDSVRIRELFGPNDVLDTFVELDHYGPRLGACYAGPIVNMPDARRVKWQDTSRARVLAYLRPGVPGFSLIMRSLAHLDAEVLCVAPGLKSSQAKNMATRHLRIALTPVDVTTLLQDADLAVGYGSCGFTTQALLAGVPLLLRPRYVEQALLGMRVEALGAGRLISGRVDVEVIEGGVQEILTNSDYGQAAGTMQERYRNFSPVQAVELTCSRIEQVLGKD